MKHQFYTLRILPLLASLLCAQTVSENADDLPNFKGISVTIGGSFTTTGTFPASPTERVDQFLTSVFSKLQKAKPDMGGFAKRGILLKRISGETVMVDLAKFQVTGDFKFNPYLKNEDVLVIPPYNLTYNFVTIDGAVRVPQTLPYESGDRLSDAILLAQGVDSAFDKVTQASINRLSEDGNREQELTFSISDNPPLQRGDRIRILSEDLQRKDFKVVVDGEVFHPGSVPITKDSTTLRTVIEKVGGVKPSADLNRAEIIRGPNVFRSAIFSDDFERLLMLRMSEISYEDSASFAIDNKLRLLRGNGSLDFHKVVNGTFLDGDFIVKNGDYVYVPQKADLVYVFGQVNTPGYVKFKKGEHIDYYLEQTGGLGVTAKHEIYLIKGKTRSWVCAKKNSDLEVEDGDFIWIPKEPVRYFAYYLQQIGTFITIIGGVATVILLFFQFGKS